MKRKLILDALLAVTIIAAAMVYSGCGSSNPNDPNGSNNRSPQSPTPTPSPGSTPNGTSGITKELSDMATADSAMIIRVERDVSLKAKGAAEFVRILSGLFRGGDTLQVGDQSKAWVSCRDGSICPLGKGLYADCCRGGCENEIRIPPPLNSESQERVAFIKKSELPPVELQTFELQESRIRQLGSDEVTTQFLIADLYSSWKLVEAKEELTNLTLKLNQAGTKDDLQTLYAPMLRKTGDMQLKIMQKEAAEVSYKRAVDVEPKLSDSREKAAAHVSLSELYEKTGQKEKAVVNLEKTERLYRIEGDAVKAEAARRAITDIRKP